MQTQQHILRRFQRLFFGNACNGVIFRFSGPQNCEFYVFFLRTHFVIGSVILKAFLRTLIGFPGSVIQHNPLPPYAVLCLGTSPGPQLSVYQDKYASAVFWN